MGVEGFVSIACCPDHGLHGARERCFVCGGDVEQIPMVPCDDAAVERAAKAYAAFRTPTIGWHPETDSYAVYVYTDASETRVVESGFTSTTAAARAIPRLGAEAVLRAAGGQDVS
jgi:hypothetical protein